MSIKQISCFLMISFILSVSTQASVFQELLDPKEALVSGLGHIRGFSKQSSSVFDAPAATSYLNGFSFSSSYREGLFDDTLSMNTAFSIKMDQAVLSLGIAEQRADGIPLTLEQTPFDGADVSTFSFSRRAYVSSIALPINERLRLGLSVTGYTVSLHDFYGWGVTSQFQAIIKMGANTVSLGFDNILSKPVLYSTGSTESFEKRSSVAFSIPLQETIHFPLTFFHEYVSRETSFTHRTGGLVTWDWDEDSGIKVAVGMRKTRDVSTWSSALDLTLWPLQLGVSYEPTTVLTKDNQWFFTVGFQLERKDK
jgi:hypothetical protein